MSWTTRYPWLDFPQQVVQTARHRDALERYQKQRLRRLLVHARDQVPYYRENGGPPEADQLAQWPVLSKDDLRNRAHDFLAPGCSPHKLLAHHSSGTTGNPVKVYRSWHEERALGLLRMRALHHWGVRWHHQRVQVRPGHFNWSRNWALDLLNRLGMYRLRAVSCFDSPAQIYQSLLRLRPDYLGGYPQVLETLCLWMKEQGLPALPARWVSCGGEFFSSLARARIQQALPQAKVLETYGSVEFNLLAWQCPDSPWLHLCEDGVRVEILDEQNRPVAEGQPGRLVGTGLQSFAMPLIRLDLGDRVVAGPSRCPCGRPFATLARIEGRLLDVFWLPDGSSIHPFELTSPLLTECSLDWLQRFQLVQEAPTSLVFRYLSRSPDAASQAELVGQFLQNILGPRARLRTEPVAHFEEPASGKFRLYCPLPRAF